MKWKVYSHYLKSIGWFLAVSTILMNGVFQSFSICSNVWLSVWSNDNDSAVPENRDMYLGVYAGLGVGQGMFSTCIVYTFFNAFTKFFYTSIY